MEIKKQEIKKEGNQKKQEIKKKVGNKKKIGIWKMQEIGIGQKLEKV